MTLKRTLIASSLLLASCSWLTGQREYEANPDPNHTHADFAMYIEGDQIDFSDPKYMSGLPADDATSDDRDNHHHPSLHLHDEVGHVLHSHKPGQTIGEFFSSIGFTISAQCITLDSGVMVCPEGEKTWQMFVNGEKVQLDPDYAFADMDQILLTFGATSEEIGGQIDQMTADSCLYSQTCPWRGKPPKENCIADPEVPCVLPE